MKKYIIFSIFCLVAVLVAFTNNASSQSATYYGRADATYYWIYSAFDDSLLNYGIRPRLNAKTWFNSRPTASAATDTIQSWRRSLGNTEAFVDSLGNFTLRGITMGGNLTGTTTNTVSVARFISLMVGDPATPQFTSNLDQDTGAYSLGSYTNRFGIATGGVNRATWDSLATYLRGKLEVRGNVVPNSDSLLVLRSSLGNTVGYVDTTGKLDVAVDPLVAGVTAWIDSSNVTNDGIGNEDIVVNGVTTTEIRDGTVSLIDMNSDAIDSTKVVNGSISNADMRADAITGDKIQAGAVDSTDVTDGNLSGSDLSNGTVSLVKIQANAVDSTKVVDGSISNADLRNDAVTGAKIQAGAVDSTDVTDGNLSGSDLSNGTVALAKIQANAVDSTKIVDGSVSNGDLRNDSVTGDKIQASAIDSTDVKDGSVSVSDIANGGNGFLPKTAVGDTLAGRHAEVHADSFVIGDGTMSLYGASEIIISADTLQTLGLKLKSLSSNTNSPPIRFGSNTGGTLKYGSIYGAFGADPYIRFTAPNDAGAEVPVMDMHDTAIVFTTDNTVDIGAASDNRPKDVHISGTFYSGGVKAWSDSSYIVDGSISNADIRTDLTTKWTAAHTRVAADSANWNTGYVGRLQWDGGATGLTPATGRTSLELGTLATLATVDSSTATDNGLAIGDVAALSTRLSEKQLASATDDSVDAGLARADSSKFIDGKLAVADINQLSTLIGLRLLGSSFADSLFSRKGKEWLVPLPVKCDTTASAQDSTTVKAPFDINGLYGRKEILYVYGNATTAADSTIYGATFNPQDNNPDSLIVWAYTTDEVNTSFSIEIYNSAGTIVYSSGNLTFAAASTWTYKGVAFGTFADLNEHAIVYRVRVLNAGDAVQIGQTYFKRN